MLNLANAPAFMLPNGKIRQVIEISTIKEEQSLIKL